MALPWGAIVSGVVDIAKQPDSGSVGDSTSGPITFGGINFGRIDTGESEVLDGFLNTPNTLMILAAAVLVVALVISMKG